MNELNKTSKEKTKIFPVILSGGQGTRLWPLSRKSFPKQFLSINNLNDRSLLQNTQKRLSGLKNLSDPIIICNSVNETSPSVTLDVPTNSSPD